MVRVAVQNMYVVEVRLPKQNKRLSKGSRDNAKMRRMPLLMPPQVFVLKGRRKIGAICFGRSARTKKDKMAQKH